MTRPVRVGILGCGVVGSGTIRTLQENAESIARHCGAPIEIARVLVRDPSRRRDVTLPPGILTTSVEEILGDPLVDTVAELMGGVEPARTYLLRALRAGKHVVTANKELIAKCGEELLTEAASRHLDFHFEGAVAGGIPIIRALKLSLAANRIHTVLGIVNGTTNYILTRMAGEGLDFAAALAAAQQLGYAEADPSADVEGHDAAYKLAILASIAFQSRVPLDQVYREGISGVTDRDIRYARDLGYVIKLVALAREREGGALEVRVHPALLPATHPLASVNDVFNAVWVQGSSVGEVMFYGRGAGALPTGSAVAADLMEVARGIARGGSGRVPCTCFHQRPLLPVEEVETNYYVRTETDDRVGVLAAIATEFGKAGVSLESVLQKHGDGDFAEIVWVTHRTRERRLRNALEAIGALPVVRRVASWIRVEE